MGYEQVRREQEQRRERKLWSVCEINGKKFRKKKERASSIVIVMASLTNVVLKGPEPMALHVLGRHSLPT